MNPTHKYAAVRKQASKGRRASSCLRLSLIDRYTDSKKEWARSLRVTKSCLGLSGERFLRERERSGFRFPAFLIVPVGCIDGCIADLGLERVGAEVKSGCHPDWRLSKE